MRKFLACISPPRLIGAGLLTTLSSASLAAGFALIEQSASQMGNAFAGGAAFAGDASTVFFNPAGMTRLPAQVVGGLHYVKPKGEFDGTATDITGGAISGGNGGDAGQVGVIPNLYITVPLGEGLFAGLGINVPFGLSTKYDANWKGRYHAIESEVSTINFNPSVAYKVNRQLSLGAGVNIQYINAKLTQAIDQGGLCTPTYLQLEAEGRLPPGSSIACTGLVPQGSDGFAEVEGDNWAGGYNLGLLYEPTNSTRVGLSYRSKIKQKLNGNSKFSNIIPQFSALGTFTNTSINAGIDLPQTASFSVWHDLSSQWSVMADATWTGWDNFQELRVAFDSNQPDAVTEEDWDD
ncbi:Long-chain fatty acid transport protein, partial [hydrothermal vent metagenome]